MDASEMPICELEHDLSARTRNALFRSFYRVKGRSGVVSDLYDAKGPPRGLGAKGVYELNRTLEKLGFKKVWESEEKR